MFNIFNTNSNPEPPVYDDPYKDSYGAYLYEGPEFICGA